MNGIGLSGAGIGTLLLAPLTSSLLDRYKWRDTFRILSTLSLISIACSLFYATVLPPKEKLATVEAYDSRKLLDGELVKNKAYWMLVIAVGCALFGYYMPYVHLESEVYWVLVIAVGCVLFGYYMPYVHLVSEVYWVLVIAVGCVLFGYYMPYVHLVSEVYWVLVIAVGCVLFGYYMPYVHLVSEVYWVLVIAVGCVLFGYYMPYVHLVSEVYLNGPLFIFYFSFHQIGG